jgi:hypothetical protein
MPIAVTARQYRVQLTKPETAMTSTISHPSPTSLRSTRRKGRAGRIDRDAPNPRKLLGRYTDPLGHPREVVALPGAWGSVLVVDRDAATLGDRRLIAHLDADEPVANAALVCERYLEEDLVERRRCRRVLPEDLVTSPAAASAEVRRAQDGLQIAPEGSETQCLDRQGRTYRLGPLTTDLSIPELRWVCHPRQERDGAPRPVKVREVVAALESYEPVLLLTFSALSRYRESAEISTVVLRSEFALIQESPIVLNRRLRQAVLLAIEHQGLSMSEIAIRCGRVKRDSKGNESGETSWLARRLGILPEGGADRRTPWIHSDVLALIARRGLGISPREVELG